MILTYKIISVLCLAAVIIWIFKIKRDNAVMRFKITYYETKLKHIGIRINHIEKITTLREIEKL